MQVDSELIKSILEKLSVEYPTEISEIKEGLPEYDDQKKIIDHLLYCKDMGWVESRDLKSTSGLDSVYIKITKSGLKYLQELD